MYSEKKFKITILLTRIRRYLFIFFFVILGLIGAYVVSEFLTEIARVSREIANTVMIVTGVSVFAIGFILTSNLEFKIQEAYLEMKTLKKLNLVSFKLDKLLESSGISISDELAKELQSVNEELTMKKTKSKSIIRFTIYIVIQYTCSSVPVIYSIKKRPQRPVKVSKIFLIILLFVLSENISFNTILYSAVHPHQSFFNMSKCTRIFS